VLQVLRSSLFPLVDRVCQKGRLSKQSNDTCLLSDLAFRLPFASALTPRPQELEFRKSILNHTHLVLTTHRVGNSLLRCLAPSMLHSPYTLNLKQAPSTRGWSQRYTDSKNCRTGQGKAPLSTRLDRLRKLVLLWHGF
jgi:hypothetical protein